MRKTIAMLGAFAMLSIVPATPALAGAQVSKEDGTCSGIVPDASGNLTGAVVYGDLHVRKNKTWTTLTCHYDLAPNEAPTTSTKASGFPCYTPELTTDTRASASPGGRMVITCRLKN